MVTTEHLSHSTVTGAGRKGKPTIAEMYSGWWKRRKTTGEAIGSKMRVLIKPVNFLSEREVWMDGGGMGCAGGEDERINIFPLPPRLEYSPSSLEMTRVLQSTT